MRINQFVAQATGMSRRKADRVVSENRVEINRASATTGSRVSADDLVTLDGKPLVMPASKQTIILNKPIGYVCSRDGQGSKTIYELLPEELRTLKPVGRLDKDSSGLLLLTNDGVLAHKLTHPSFEKEKVYLVDLDKDLSEEDKQNIEQGVKLDDGPSKLGIEGNSNSWTITMHEGRNRQIRKTFEALGYQVTKLHRTEFGSYKLVGINVGNYKIL